MTLKLYEWAVFAVQWLAQYWDLLAGLAVFGLFIRALFRDRRSFKKRDNDREVVVTLVSLITAPNDALPTLRIRNVHETTVLNAMGQSNHAVRLLLDAARAVECGKPLLRFREHFDAAEIVHEVTNEVSKLTGTGFIDQECARRLLEVSFIFAVTCERETSGRGQAINVRVQLVRESHLERLAQMSIADSCPWNLDEPKNPRYQTRDATFREVLRGYLDWKGGVAGSERLAIGRVFLVPSRNFAHEGKAAA